MMEPLLELRGVHKRFGAVVAAEAVDLDVRAGEIHALIGPNGAGKSSLIAQIAGELRPDRGRVHFAGIDLTERPPAARARLGLARSFQVTSLFDDLSVLENAVLAAQPRLGHSFRLLRPATSRATVREAALAALAEVGLDKRPDDPVAALGHGEKRQLEIGLALAGGPRLLLLDEPLAGQAAADGEATVALLDRLRRRHAMLLVEHDMDAVFQLADRVTVMVEGRTIASGTAAEVRNDPDARSAYLGDA
jgi:branched-chain amino acid transport system ATP-binding protein